MARAVRAGERLCYQLDQGLVNEIRVATHDNHALDCSQFQAQAAAALRRQVMPD